MKSPLLLIQPSFTERVRADSTRSYLRSFFVEPWRGRLENRPRTETRFVEDAGILVHLDQPALVDRTIAEFLERHGK